MTTQALWYASRATGLVSLLLFTATVVLGALNGRRASAPGLPRFALAALHRNLSLLAVAFLGIHIVTAIADPYAGIGWLDAVVPFGSRYKPVWLGFGAVALDLLIAVVVTSLLRPRINARWWKLVHWSAYALWPLAVIHGLGTGGVDSRTGWVVAVTLGCVVAVIVAVGWRLSAEHQDTRARAAVDPARWGR